MTGSLQNFIKLTEFLGRVLGPDYEISLYEVEEDSGSLIAISNNHISGKELGSPLTDTSLKLILDQSYHDSDYRINYRSATSEYKVLRTSTLFIKDSSNRLIGLLCISFDNTRFKNVSEQILGLCHPDAFVETNFLFDAEAISVRAIGAPGVQNSPRNGSISDVIWEELGKQNLLGKKLTQQERISVIEVLAKKNLFLIKGTVPQAAELLGCSSASVYRYLSQVSKKK